MEESLVFRLRKRAEIRRSIKTRKSVQNNEPDRIADLLEEAADKLKKYEKALGKIAYCVIREAKDPFAFNKWLREVAQETLKEK